MRRVDRIHELFLKLNENKEKSFYVFWKTYFDVENTIEIFKKLVYLEKEVRLFELELKSLRLDQNQEFIKTINTLNSIILNRSLDVNIINQSYMQENNFNLLLASLSMFKTFADANHIESIIEDDIPEKELSEFKKYVEDLIKSLNDSNIDEADKKIFLELYNNFVEALSLYKINGLEAFEEAIRKNICKMQLIQDSINDDKYEFYKNGAKKITGIVFSWSIKYIRKKVLGIIDNKIVKYIEEHVDEWKALPFNGDSKKNSNDVEDDAIDAEIED